MKKASLSKNQLKCIDMMIYTDMSQADMAKQMGVHPNTVTNWKKNGDFIAAKDKQLRFAMQDIAVEAFKKIHKLLDAANEMVQLNAAKDILDRAGFKPISQIEHGGQLEIKENPYAGLSLSELQCFLHKLADRGEATPDE